MTRSCRLPGTVWRIAFHGGATSYYLSLLCAFLTHGCVVFFERMITTWYLALHIYFIISLFMQDLISVLLGKHSKIHSIMAKINNILFISIVFPFALYIPLTYWILFYYNKNLIHPTFLEVSLPPWVSTSSHSIITIVALTEMVSTKYIYKGNYFVSAMILLTFSSCYAACLITTYVQFGFWIYPVFHLFSEKMLPFVFTLLGVVLLGMFFIGSMINQIIHGKNETCYTFDPLPPPPDQLLDSDDPCITRRFRSLQDSYQRYMGKLQPVGPVDKPDDDLIDSEPDQCDIKSTSEPLQHPRMAPNASFSCRPVHPAANNTLELTEDRVVIRNAPFMCNSTTKIAFEKVIGDDRSRSDGKPRRNIKSKSGDIDSSDISHSFSYEEGSLRPNAPVLNKGNQTICGNSNPAEHERRIQTFGRLAACDNEAQTNHSLKLTRELRDFVNHNLVSKCYKKVEEMVFGSKREQSIPQCSDDNDTHLIEGILESNASTAITEESIVHSNMFVGNGEGQPLLDSPEDSLNSISSCGRYMNQVSKQHLLSSLTRDSDQVMRNIACHIRCISRPCSVQARDLERNQHQSVYHTCKGSGSSSESQTEEPEKRDIDQKCHCHCSHRHPEDVHTKMDNSGDHSIHEDIKSKNLPAEITKDIETDSKPLHDKHQHLHALHDSLDPTSLNLHHALTAEENTPLNLDDMNRNIKQFKPTANLYSTEPGRKHHREDQPEGHSGDEKHDKRLKLDEIRLIVEQNKIAKPKKPNTQDDLDGISEPSSPPVCEMNDIQHNDAHKTKIDGKPEEESIELNSPKALHTNDAFIKLTPTVAIRRRTSEIKDNDGLTICLILRNDK